MAAPTKEYGLIKRSVSTIQPKLAIFDEDDSDEDGHISVGKSIQKEADKFQSKKQVKLNIQNALTEDPTVFEYDEIYDDMVRTKEKQTTGQKQSKEKKPQYIGALMKAAKVRKLEQERAVERKVQKEREAEGEMYAGKDSFVTSAYKMKMLELQELEEKERHEAQIEALTDVTKQKDLSGFYRNLYRQTLGPQQKPSTSTNDADIPIKVEIETPSTLTDAACSAEVSQRPKVVVKREPPSPPGKQLEKQPRQFRKRQNSSSSSNSSESSEDESASSSAKKSKTSAGNSDRLASRNPALPKSRNESQSGDDDSDGAGAKRDRQLTERVKSAKPSSQQSRGGDSEKKAGQKSLRRSSSSPEMQGRLRSPVKSNKGDRPGAGESDDASKRQDVEPVKVEAVQKKHIEDEDLDADDTATDSDESGSSDSDGEKKKPKKVPKENGVTPRERLLALFKKRTVDAVFDAAVERYQTRKNIGQPPQLVSAN